MRSGLGGGDWIVSPPFLFPPTSSQACSYQRSPCCYQKPRINKPREKATWNGRRYSRLPHSRKIPSSQPRIPQVLSDPPSPFTLTLANDRLQPGGRHVPPSPSLGPSVAVAAAAAPPEAATSASSGGRSRPRTSPPLSPARGDTPLTCSRRSWAPRVGAADRMWESA